VGGGPGTTSSSTDDELVLEYRGTSTYDGSGHLLETNHDFEADGTVELVETFEYDAWGNRVRWHWDLVADDYGDVTEVYTYDAEDHLTSSTRLLPDGSVNGMVTYHYDSSGLLVQIFEDFRGDGVPEGRYDCAYDTRGNMTMEDFTDLESDDHVSRESRTYNADDLPVTTRFVYFVDLGLSDYFVTMDYDAKGNVAMYESDWGDDGTVDSRTTMTWQCWP
jgi:YD repeat-containing protein